MGNAPIKEVVKSGCLAVIVTFLVIAINWYPSPEFTGCGLVRLCGFGDVIAVLQSMGSLLVIAVALVYLCWSLLAIPAPKTYIDWTKLRSWQNYNK